MSEQGDVARPRKWSDAKKVNAQRIRLRMKEQQGKKMMPTTTTTTRMTSPPLTIAVTMSEEYDCEEPEEEISLNKTNMSSWAMMEYYSTNTGTGTGTGTSTGSTPAQVQHQSLEHYSLNTSHSTTTSSSTSSHNHIHNMMMTPSRDIFVPPMDEWEEEEKDLLDSEVSEILEDTNDGSRQISWHVVNGELVPESPATNATSTTGRDQPDHSYESKESHDEQSYNGRMVQWQEMEEIQEDQDSSEHYVSEDEEHDDQYFPNPIVEQSSITQQTQTQTPARLHKDWQEETSDNHSTPSLLQQSMIQSEYNHNHNHNSIDNDNDTSDHESAQESQDTSKYDNLTQLSIGSLQNSDSSSTNNLSRALVLLQTPASKENFTYLARIGELEQHLKEQKYTQLSGEQRLQHRVQELEQALKTTATTPRGTIVDNPLMTLLERNKTLVKEVRFADQTCVELSSKTSALQAQVEILQEQLDQSQKLNIQLQDQQEELTNQVDRLTADLQDAQDTVDHLKGDSVDGVTIRSVLEELKLEMGELERETQLGSPETASSIFSDPDSLLANASTQNDDIVDNNKSFVSQGLAKALQTQLRRIQSKAQQAEKSQVNLIEQLQQVTLEKQQLQAKLEQEHPQMAELQSENDFLGRQLGKVQEKLEQATHTLEQERTEIQAKEELWEQEVTDQLQKVEALTKQLEKATHQMFLSPDGPTSPRLQSADKRVFGLEKELAHAQASLVAMKRESEKLLANVATSKQSSLETEKETQVIQITRTMMTRMLDQYQFLEHQVKEATDNYAERLNRLVEMVAYLRSSLLFETDSVSTQVQDTSHLVMNATTTQSKVHPDDEMMQLMEEARSPPSVKYGDVDDTDEDMSRMFSDDGTLESLVKNISGSGSVASHNDSKWKEPLEAAVRECQRVRERLGTLQQGFAAERSKFQQEIESHKKTIDMLEAENGKLSLSSSRTSEEKRLIEKALSEAKQNIDELESRLEAVVTERDEIRRDAQEKNQYVEEMKAEHSDLQITLRQSLESNSSLELQLSAVKSEISDLEDNYLEATTSLDESNQRCNELVEELKQQESDFTQRRNEETELLRQALRQAESELEELKRIVEVSEKKLSRACEEKTEFQKMVTELQATRNEFFSNAEDKVLDAEFKLEEVRKERAELKARLSRVEKELSSAKESFTNYKNRVKERLDEREAAIESLQSERSDITYNAGEMVLLRRELISSLHASGVCGDLIHRIGFADDDPSIRDGASRSMRELSHWKQIVPALSSFVQSTVGNQERMEELEMETERLSDELSRHAASEEQSKIQNENLFALLRQAEVEMERSASQIRSMSAALASLQEHEAEANHQARSIESQWQEDKAKFDSFVKDVTAERDVAQRRLNQMEATLGDTQTKLSESTANLSSTQQKLEEVKTLLDSKDANETELRSKADSLETKCTRLREYVHKLTRKCEEWEASYERQAKLLEKLEARNGRTRQKASELAQRYNKLTGDIQRRSKVHNNDRDKWTAEKSTLHQVHTQLEEELEVIAKELANIDVAWN